MYCVIFVFISRTQFTFVDVVVSYFEFNQLLNVMYLVQLGFNVVFQLVSNILSTGHGHGSRRVKRSTSLLVALCVCSVQNVQLSNMNKTFAFDGSY